MEVVLGWIIGVFKGVVGLIPLLRKPDLSLDVIEATSEPYLLESFKVIIRNKGNKSAEDATILLKMPRNSNLEIVPNENEIEILHRDSVWKGLFGELPEWEGPEQSWHLKRGSLHPHQDVCIGNVFVHPSFPGWHGRRWTLIKWGIFAKDTKKFSGEIRIPIGGSRSGIWVTRD
jgi:hypothetical protein